MKIESLKEHLHRAISLAEHVTGKRLPLQILSRVIIEARDNNLFIKATNLDLGIEIKVPAKIINTGKLAVQGSLLENYLANLGHQTTITLETTQTNNNLLVTTGASSALIACDKADDFPQLPELQGKIKDKNELPSTLAVEAQIFVSGLRAVAYAASLSDIKPELASVYVRVEDGDIILATTDSFRLAEKRINSRKNNILPGLEDYLIPAKNVSEVIRVFGETKSDIIVTYNKNQVSFQTNDIYLTSRLVEGSFPAYSQLIPKSFTTQAVMLKEDLASSIRLASVFSDKFHQVTMKIIPDDSLFELSARNQEAGESTVRVDATVEGEMIDIGLNARYLSDCFQYIQKDSVTLGFNGPGKAMLLRAVGDRTFTYLVMPLHK